MLQVLTKYWWAVLLRGVLAVLFGVMAFAWPAITVIVLVALFGAYALVDGVIAIGQAAFGGREAVGRRGWLLLEGVASIIVGVMTVVWPSITALILLWLIAAWALLTGVFEIVAAVRLRKEIEGEWLLALAGALSLLFGIALVVRPSEGAIAVAWLIGGYAVVFGASLIAFGLHLRQLARDSTDGYHRPAHA